MLINVQPEAETGVHWDPAEFPPEWMTVGEILRLRAALEPARTAFILVAGDGSEEVLTYRDVDRMARAVAVTLGQREIRGERVLVSLVPGRGYLAALYGCLLAGAIAVPCAPPGRRRRNVALGPIAMDAQPRALITDAYAHNTVARDVASARDAGRMRTILIEEIDEQVADSYQAPFPRPHIALLQYTSGSTGAPKGVVIGHDNLLANARCIAEQCDLSRETVLAGWCPPYHDMGLFGGIVGPVIVGFPSVHLSPLDFLLNPRAWLEAITRHRATFAAGPNFAYDLCVDRIPAEDRAGLDLSSWACAISGGEAVRAATIDRFAAAFAPCGFREEAFWPCYGMAESTLFITGGSPDPGRRQPPARRIVDAAQLARGQAAPARRGDPGSRAVVGCGTAARRHTIRVVDPGTRQPVLDGNVGEVWVKGPSVAHGYWRNPTATEATFRATTPNCEGLYLRTGDLGFQAGGELYIVGRIKDLIIIRGRNHSPDDIELTVRHSHPALRPDGVAFALERGGAECLAIAHEVDLGHPDFDPAQVAVAVRAAVAAEHDIEAQVVALLPPKTVPKTTSGKPQRAACRARFLTGTLPTISVWERSAAGDRDERAAGISPPGQPQVLAEPSAERIEDWLAGRLAGTLGTDPRDVDVNRPFADFGLDSVQGVRIAADLTVLLGTSLPATLVWEHPTIAKLATHLAALPR
jgi:acyl-CoA synthetase (AMP-forming)/AMP-acid ligase II/acyl carrier protein